ncbi:MAG: hypothetical protein RMY28_024850 [Nostoc sp. ChiSLP01]|nr:hypothetical protein [Nostoc sp. CmiSLP01]MDZ8282666.1 hypothetical protein [Nostoc sp. ChiSLP01]
MVCKPDKQLFYSWLLNSAEELDKRSRQTAAQLQTLDLTGKNALLDTKSNRSSMKN